MREAYFNDPATVTMLLAAEALDAQRVLVLAPTLLLVKQLRDEWISKRRPDREWASLAVCSDIGDGMDASEIAPAEFGAPPTTNPDDIAAFLKKPGHLRRAGCLAAGHSVSPRPGPYCGAGRWGICLFLKYGLH